MAVSALCELKKSSCVFAGKVYPFKHTVLKYGMRFGAISISGLLYYRFIVLKSHKKGDRFRPPLKIFGNGGGLDVVALFFVVGDVEAHVFLLRGNAGTDCFINQDKCDYTHNTTPGDCYCHT